MRERKGGCGFDSRPEIGLGMIRILSSRARRPRQDKPVYELIVVPIASCTRLIRATWLAQMSGIILRLHGLKIDDY